MLRKFPYWGWLLLAICLWVAAWLQNTKDEQNQTPKKVAESIQKSLRDMYRDGSAILADTDRQNMLFEEKGQLQMFNLFNAKLYDVFAYDQDILVFWSTNKMKPSYQQVEDTLGHFEKVGNEECIVLSKKIHNGEQTIVICYPIKQAFIIENEYIKNTLFAQPNNNLITTISNEPQKNGFNIYNNENNHFWCNVVIEKNPDSVPSPSSLVIYLFIVASAVSVFWIQLAIVSFAERTTWKKGLVLILVVLVTLRTAVYIFPLPFHLDSLPVFSANLFAFTKWVPSLGDFIFSQITILSAIVFIIWKTPLRDYFKRVSNPYLLTFSGYGLGLVIGYFNSWSWRLLTSLVQDSQIPFDLLHTNTINFTTIIALISIALGIMTSISLNKFCYRIIRQCIPNIYIRYTVTIFAISLVSWLINDSLTINVASVVLLLIVFVILDIRTQAPIMRPLSLYMMMISLITCAGVVLILQREIGIRDAFRDRVSYASFILTQEDPLMEYNFSNISSRIVSDPQIRNYFHSQNTDSASSNDLKTRLTNLYFYEFLNKYIINIEAYKSSNLLYANIKPISRDSLEQIFAKGTPTLASTLQSIESDAGKKYFAKIGFKNDIEEIGTLFLTFTPRNNIDELVYPELLQPASINHLKQSHAYEYAEYKNGRLVRSTNSGLFPSKINTKNTYYDPVLTKAKKGINLLYYQEVPNQIIVVADTDSGLLLFGVLFAYSFSIFIILYILSYGYRFMLSYFLKHSLKEIYLTLNQRITLYIQITILIALLIISVITVIFFSYRYQKTTLENNKQQTNTFVRFINATLLTSNSQKLSIDSIVKQQDFQYSISSFARNEKNDINIFNKQGALIFTTQNDIYSLDLLAPTMHPSSILGAGKNEQLNIVSEDVGNFKFESCYAKLIADNGETIGYLSVPFFTIQKERNEQISNIVVVFINLYVFFFLIVSIVTHVITRRITRTFGILKEKFERMSLQQNELVDWPYNDEIGALVKEYNKMVRKVEDSAERLAQSEREMAWREMAKQVAHEIKNPLTPMKLNIQYLQNALHNDHPDVLGLVERVSKSIIEQIDNLSYIASAFSTFAKIPEAVPEELNLTDLLQKITALFQNNENITCQIVTETNNTTVLADKSQMLRVFTNLIQNAIQSIPEEKEDGKVVILISANEHNALVAISDNGSGIPVELRQKIFVPYFTTKTSGTGLGLAMSRKIIEHAGGSIWFITSTGKGTTFYMEMPLMDKH